MVSLKKALSRSIPGKKEREVGKETEAHRASPERTPPPSYQDTERTDELPVANLRRLTFKGKSESLDQLLPTNDECIAHLKLLTAFAHLREEVSETSDLFDLRDELAANTTSDIKDSKDNSGFVKIREKRWAVYVNRAVDRFTKWWQTLMPGRGKIPSLRMEDILHSNRIESLLDSNTRTRWTAEMLPPLDVLMVLHAFLLNPRNFLEDCLRLNMMPLWYAGFPWHLVSTAINDQTFEYSPDVDATSHFEQLTGLNWDNLHDPGTRKITCGGCGHQWDWAYTNAAFGNDVNFAFESSQGYTDKGFELQCFNCARITNHQSLCLAKFRKDLVALMDEQVPMPGTILSLNGLPEAAKSTDPHKHEMFFANRMLLAGLASRVLEKTNPDNNRDGKMKVNDVRKLIEEALQDRRLISKANGKTIPTKSLKAPEKVAVRRMMSRYWDNSSPFALDLVGAVLRQGIFVEKMKDIDWVHSPALENTMSRLIQKYQVFFKIIATNPGKVAVPTLDVDLAWHTHQMSPQSYYEYSLAQTKTKLVDHDDKIDENKLSNSFEWTSYQYQKITGEAYSECTCWYCEAIREAHTYRIFSSSARDKQLALFDQPNISSDPNKNPHISAHNSVKGESLAADLIAIHQLKKLDLDYKRAVKRAEKAGKTPPSRDAYSSRYVWGTSLLWLHHRLLIESTLTIYAIGYPMYLPMQLYPYGGAAFISGSMYPNNPCSMSTGIGAAGKCVETNN